MTQTEKIIQDYLESLSELSKEELLKETKQLLLSIAYYSNNPVKDLTLLYNYFNTNKLINTQKK